MGGGRGKKESGGEMMSEVHCTQYNYMWKFIMKP
jgi:hypothetical protein